MFAGTHDAGRIVDGCKIIVGGDLGAAEKLTRLFEVGLLNLGLIFQPADCVPGLVQETLTPAEIGVLLLDIIVKIIGIAGKSVEKTVDFSGTSAQLYSLMLGGGLQFAESAAGGINRLPQLSDGRAGRPLGHPGLADTV